MAAITTAGKVTAKEGTEAVTVREFGNGGKIAKFNMVDSEYFYVKEGDDRKGQFYTVEVSGKQADIVFVGLDSVNWMPVNDPANQLVLSEDGTGVSGYCFTPQDGNSLLSSVAATVWGLYPETYDKIVQCLRPYFFQEV